MRVEILWTPGDRPPNEGYYLVTGFNDNVFEAFFVSDGEWRIGAERVTNNSIKAWAPMPDPWTG